MRTPVKSAEDSDWLLFSRCRSADDWFLGATASRRVSAGLALEPFEAERLSSAGLVCAGAVLGKMSNVLPPPEDPPDEPPEADP